MVDGAYQMYNKKWSLGQMEQERRGFNVCEYFRRVENMAPSSGGGTRAFDARSLQQVPGSPWAHSKEPFSMVSFVWIVFIMNYEMHWLTPHLMASIFNHSVAPVRCTCSPNNSIVVDNSIIQSVLKATEISLHTALATQKEIWEEYILVRAFLVNFFFFLF